MTDYLWIATGLLLGLALGLWCGQMLLCLFVYWRSIDTIVKTFKVIVMYLFGAGGGAAIVGILLSPDALIAYAAGIGIGLIVGRFLPLPPLGRDERRQRETLSGHLPEDLLGRDVLISLATEPARRMQHEARISETELAQEMENALDLLAEREQGEGKVTHE